MRQAPTIPRWLVAVLIGGIALCLAWQVISRSLVAALAEAEPEVALWLRPDDPVALLSLANRALTAQQGRSPPSQATHPASNEGLEPAGPDRTRIAAWSAVALRTDRTEGAGAPQAATPVPRSEVQAPQISSAGSGTDDQIRAWALASLRSDPLNARAFRIMGQLTPEADGDAVRRYMQGAARRSLRESAAAYWLMRDGFAKGDYETALFYADTLLRARPQIAEHVIAVLGWTAENTQDGSTRLKALLAANPPWRAQFFSAVLGNVFDARTPLDLLLSTQQSPHPPSAAELGEYLSFLIGRGLYELAYYTWLQFLSLDQLSTAGFLFNGNFETAAMGVPFDWVIRPGSGATVDIAPRPDDGGQHALFVQFGLGRVQFPGVAQLVVLPPGNYRFAGKHRGHISGRRGLVWRIACAANAAPLAQASIDAGGAAPAWREFDVAFTVPRTDCPAQYVRLELDARMASKQLVSGTVWSDDLRISRAPANTAPVAKP